MFERTVDYPAYRHDERISPLDEASKKALAETIELIPVLREHAAQTEREGRLPQHIIERMGEIGIWFMGGPVETGGSQFDYPTQFRIIEELARGDGTAGWCVLTHLAGAALTMRLDLEAAQGIWKSPVTIVAGSPMPAGRAMRVDGGYRILEGKWMWATNARHATHYLGGFQIVQDENDPGMPFPPPEGAPLIPQGEPPMVAYFDRKDVQFVDGSWDVIGLRGTSSGSYEVKELFLPENRAFSMMSMMAEPPLHVRGPIGVGGHAAVHCGIARHMLEEFLKLAKAKRPTGFGVRDLLADMPAIQHELGLAEAKLRGARAHYYRVVDDCWARWKDGEEISTSDYLESEMANVNLARVAREVAETLNAWAGGSVLKTGDPMERGIRDMLTAGAHMAIQRTNWATFGKALFGRPVMMSNAFEAASISPRKKTEDELSVLGREGGTALANGSAVPTEADLAIATNFVQAMINKDIDAAQALMHDDIVMTSPMGTENGPQACGDMLRNMVSMGSTPMNLPELVGGEIVAINEAPIGNIAILFGVNDNKIASVGMRPAA
ncbi:MAG: acyl-CoA dehydrogenase family protein [Sphingomonadaceae bacterium]|nr:acyl-CoA dehydrogenase family protein [Sphingomonadaceae bacterium]